VSSANLDLVRSIYADWERGDYGSADWADPEVELVLADGPFRGTWSGLEGMARGWGEFLSAWEDMRAIPDEYFELDDVRIAVLMHNVGRGKGSGVDVGPMRQRSLNLFEIRGGKVTRVTAYWEAERALEELGIADR
jgi:ketosteroid isomerase-like protein